jgi:hypothetical protein
MAEETSRPSASTADIPEASPATSAAPADPAAPAETNLEDAIPLSPTAPREEAPDPAARLPEGGSAVEYWDLTADLDSGYHLFVRFAITNEGPGDQLGFATGELVDAEGRVTHFRNGRTRSRWTLSSDRLRMDIGKSHLDLHGPRYRLEVTKSYVKIDLSFPPRAGTTIPQGVLPKGYAVDLLALASPVEGTIWLKGMSKGLKVQGQIAAVHTVVQKSEAQLMRRRIELFAQKRDAALYVADFTTPSGKRSHWLCALDGSSGSEQIDKLMTETAFDIELSGDLFPPGKAGKHKNYWVPRRVELSADVVEGEASLTRSLVESDPLSDLPQPLRYFAGRKSSPRRVWSSASFAVTLHPRLGQAPLHIQDIGVAAIDFTTPLTRP